MVKAFAHNVPRRCAALSTDLSGLLLSPVSSCFNDGTCIDGINSYTCRCQPGFTGSNCQFDIDECDSKPCQNGATCVDGLGGYRCTCPSGYSGNNCQQGPAFVAVTPSVFDVPSVFNESGIELLRG
eukprot:g23784.t1